MCIRDRINSELIGLIGEILEKNDELLEGNRENLQIFNEMTSDFSAYLDKEGDLSDLASTNQDEHNEVFDRASDNTNMLEQVFSSADANGQALIGLRNTIDQQRAAISQQWTQIEAQQELCFDVIDGKD